MPQLEFRLLEHPDQYEIRQYSKGFDEVRGARPQIGFTAPAKISFKNNFPNPKSGEGLAVAVEESSSLFGMTIKCHGFLHYLSSVPFHEHLGEFSRLFDNYGAVEYNPEFFRAWLRSTSLLGQNNLNLAQFPFLSDTSIKRTNVSKKDLEEFIPFSYYRRKGRYVSILQIQAAVPENGIEGQLLEKLIGAEKAEFVEALTAPESADFWYKKGFLFPGIKVVDKIAVAWKNMDYP